MKNNIDKLYEFRNSLLNISEGEEVINPSEQAFEQTIKVIEWIDSIKIPSEYDISFDYDVLGGIAIHIGSYVWIAIMNNGNESLVINHFNLSFQAIDWKNQNQFAKEELVKFLK